jgi:hypothetical protein
MKTISIKKWPAAYAAMLAAGMAFHAAADQPSASPRPENHSTGTVISVDPNNHILVIRGFVLDKKFNLGNACTYALLDKNPGAAADLRPGEKVAVNYQDASGVLIADRVEQQPMRLEGMVRSLDPAAHTMTVRGDFLQKAFQIADGCNVVLRDEKTGDLKNLQVGDHVTVTYETPNGRLTAREIAQTSITFTGTLTAIDLDERTVKARSFLDTKKFNLADGCAIVINGKPDGKLADLKPNDRLDVSYDEINGVNVANRIAPAGGTSEPTAMTANRPHDSGMPMGSPY